MQSEVLKCSKPDVCVRGLPGVKCSGARRVAYQLTDFTKLASLSSLTPAQAASGVVGEDEFTVIVADAQGFNSTAATVHVVVTTPFVAAAAEPVATTLQGAPVNVTLTARDYSSPTRPLTAVIASLPSHGALTYNPPPPQPPSPSPQPSPAPVVLAVGSKIPLAYPASGGGPATANVTFTPEAGYFNSPATNWNGSAVAGNTGNVVFTFRVERPRPSSTMRHSALMTPPF